MKKLLLLFFIVLAGGTLLAQTTALQYSRVLIVSNTEQTVPTGKVWKITSLTGALYNTYCTGRPDMLPSPSQWVKAGVASGFLVNGNTIHSILKYSTSTSRYSDNICTSVLGSTDYSSWSQTTDPLVLPMWLPAGTTLKTIGSGVYVSVLEFSEI
ncbi:MAG: hypothetical protein IT223_01645 [Crocinitomicaceae bacterium]|nr:hypothetical protein [Crocinitomicaceae bacterium]